MSGPMTMQQRVERDNFLRRLAINPAEAMHHWRRLTEGERTVVITYMTLYYDIAFARQFREGFSGRRPGDMAIEITNDPSLTPERLTAAGYRLRQTDGGVQYWTHPLGKQIWHLPAPRNASPPLTGGSLVEYVRHLVDSLIHVNGRDMSTEELNAYIAQLLEVRAEDPGEYAGRYQNFSEDLQYWDRQYADAMSQVTTWRRNVGSESRSALEVEIVHLTSLSSWRRNVEALIQRGDLPPPQ